MTYKQQLLADITASFQAMAEENRKLLKNAPKQGVANHPGHGIPSPSLAQAA